MIAQLLYRDAGNYKTVLGLEVPEGLEVNVGDELPIEDFGKTPEWLWKQRNSKYDPELDHNLVEVEALYETMEEYDKENPIEKVKETKVYLINDNNYTGTKHTNALTDEEFMDIAEEQGNVYSLKGFEEAFNNDDVSSVCEYIRILTN